MKSRVITTILLALLSVGVIHISHAFNSNDQFIEFYGKEIRNNLFGAFLTLSAFLFSLKTFIIVKMKESVYDHPKYLERLNKKRKVNSELSQYGPLKRLSQMLYLVILLSFISSISQLVLGLSGNYGAVLFCLFLAICSCILFAFSLELMRQNFDSWFDLLEKESLSNHKV